jgi:uncharacterized protein (DUF2062 family)
MKQWIYERMQKWISLESSPSKLTAAVLLGNFMAFSPYLGLQTWLCLLLSWLLKWNAKISLATLYIISNPWTMVPIIGLDYLVGYWLMHSLLGLDLFAYNPAWMSWLNIKIKPYLHRFLGMEQIGLWYYIIGGHIVAIITTLILYPFVLRSFRRFVQFKQQ